MIRGSWRTSLGWVGVGCVVLYFVPKFVLGAFFWARACWTTNQLLPYPVSFDECLQLLLPLVAIGGIKTYEKIRGLPVEERPGDKP